MELESYIDRINATIEWLESEQLTVTNNIITLKTEFNRAKSEYDTLLENIDIESQKYADLLMANVRLTTQQNQPILDKIREDSERIREKSEELDRKETEFLTKMSEVCEREERVSEKKKNLSDRGTFIISREKSIEQMEKIMEARGQKLEKLIQENEKREKELQSLIGENKNEKSRVEELLRGAENRHKIADSAIEMRLLDIERREWEITLENARISSEWKALKQAKAHIETISNR